MENSAERLNSRQEKILEQIQTKGYISINELAVEFDVHQMTIRRDLKKLERMGTLVRTYGGAQAHPGRRVFSYLTDEDINENIEKKISIAKFIVNKLINNGDRIFLDTGSTILQIAKLLNRRKKITVITNSIDIMAELYHQPDITTVVLGGELSGISSNLHGPHAINQLKSWNKGSHISFFSCDGVVSGENEGFYTNHDIDASLAPHALKTGEKKCVVVDSSKIGKKTLYKFADFNDVDLLITDSGINDDQLSELKKFVEVAIAEIKPI